ncbi:hypothetical protein FACS1894217_07970 [Clostridia bacterium]|nr:hypothetical protein FACS1894217_07970 [Clostridia bacterium]
MSRLLGKNKLRSSVKRLPSELREDNGCGYAVRVDDHRRAMKLLRAEGAEYGRVYHEVDGRLEEFL